MNPNIPHEWAKRPDWDDYLQAAIDRFVAKGGTITYIKLGKLTGDGITSTGIFDKVKFKKGRARQLPLMTAYQKQVYYKLKKNGIEREEALKTALAIPSKGEKK